MRDPLPNLIQSAARGFAEGVIGGFRGDVFRPQVHGRAALTDGKGTVVVLELLSGRNVWAVGYYLSSHHPEPTLHRLRFTIERDLVVRLEEGARQAKLQLPLKDHPVSLAKYPPIRMSVHQPRPKRSLWIGSVVHGKKSETETLTFRLEQYGPSQIAESSPVALVAAVGPWLIPPIIWGGLCGAALLRDMINSCGERAVAVCGEGNVAEVQSDFIVGLICKVECSWKCKDADDDDDEPSPGEYWPSPGSGGGD